jgi:hypothetical protein
MRSAVAVEDAPEIMRVKVYTRKPFAAAIRFLQLQLLNVPSEPVRVGHEEYLVLPRFQVSNCALKFASPSIDVALLYSS